MPVRTAAEKSFLFQSRTEPEGQLSTYLQCPLCLLWEEQAARKTSGYRWRIRGLSRERGEA